VSSDYAYAGSIVAKWASDMFQSGGFEPQFDTIAEAISMRGLNWGVYSQPATTSDNDGNVIPVPGYFAVVRDDTNEALAVNGRAYTCVDNATALAPIDNLTKHGYGIVDVAELNGGRQLAALLSSEPVKLAKNEILFPLCVCRTSHDGSWCYEEQFFVGRGACMNGLIWTVSGFNAGGKHKHTAGIFGRLFDTAADVRNAALYTKAVVAEARVAIATPMSREEAHTMLQAIVPDPEGDDVSKAKATRAENVRDAILARLYRSANLDEIRDTRWGLLNAVCEYVDHEGQTKLVERAVSVDPARQLAELRFAKATSANPLKERAHAVVIEGLNA